MWSARGACVGCAIALLAAGCGSGDNTSSSATAATDSGTAPTSTQAEPSSTSTTTAGPASAEILGVNVTTATAGRPGAVVQSVPADTRSQLRAGDVIVAYNGEPVASAEELQRFVDTAELGKSFKVTVIRGSKHITFAEVPRAVTYLGVKAGDSKDPAGAAVVAVAPKSPADKAGLQRGDVITAVGGAQISETQDLLNAVGAQHPGDTVTIGFIRNGHQHEAKAVLGTRPSP